MRLTSTNSSYASAVAVTAIAAVAGSASAATVQESFDYTTGQQLSGQTGGTGWSGAWNDQFDTPSNAVIGAGLTFSNLEVSGAGLHSDYHGEPPTFFSRTLSGLPSTSNFGDLAVVYSSHLVQRPTGAHAPFINVGSFVSNRFGTRVTATEFEVQGPFGISTASLAATLPANESFLVLSRMTAEFPFVRQSSWLLSAAQFDAFKAGGLTDAELDAASLGTGASNVWGKAEFGNAGIGPTSFGSVYTNNGHALSNGYQLIDEIRLSAVSLDDVTPLAVPEPTTLAAVASIGLLVLGRRSRGNVVR